MTTLVKCRFCLRNGSHYVAVPDGQPVRCEYCKRVQPLETSTRTPTETIKPGDIKTTDDNKDWF